MHQEETDIAPPMESDDVTWKEITFHLQVECKFTQYVNVDNEGLTCEPLPDSAICTEAHGAIEQEDAASEEEEIEEPPISKSQDVMEAIETIKLHLYNTCQGNEEVLEKISDIEKFFLKRTTSSRQSICDYLQ